VGRRHQQVAFRQPRLVVDHLPGGVEDLAGDPHVIADREGQARLAVVQDQAAGVELVVDVAGRRDVEVAHDRLAERRRDVARRRPGAEDAIALGLRVGLGLVLCMEGR
jgi:hypothetical protein